MVVKQSGHKSAHVIPLDVPNLCINGRVLVMTLLKWGSNKIYILLSHAFLANSSLMLMLLEIIHCLTNQSSDTNSKFSWSKVY